MGGGMALRVDRAGECACAQHFLVHRGDADTLADVTRVENRLIVDPHGGLGVQDNHIAQEAPATKRGVRCDKEGWMMG